MWNSIVCRYSKMDNTQVCSRCKKVNTRTRGTSIHKTLAYARCRCHRFSNKRHDSIEVSSTCILNIPEPKSDSSTDSQSVVKSVVSTVSHLSPSTHSVQTAQSITTSDHTCSSDQQITLPRICERQSLVADLSTSTDLYSNGYSNLGTLVTKGTQMNAQSVTALEKSSLPKLLPRTSCRCIILV